MKVKIHTNGLEVGSVYSVWWVVFNNPAACEGRCNDPDLSNPETGGSLLWAKGKVARSSDATFAARLQEGHPPGEVLFGPGLTDAADAEIHLIVRTHGPRIPGQVREQRRLFEGGCDVNTCANIQFAIPE